MDEPQGHTRCHLVDHDVVVEVAADPPVALAGRAVVDPGAPRCLQEGVAQHQDEATAGFERARHFADRGLERVDVLDREAQEHGIERRGPAGERVGARPRVAGTAGAGAGGRELRGCGIEPDHVDTQTGEMARDLTLATAEIEHAGGVREVARHQREDLVLVLGVGAGRELALPPLRVAFPEGFVVRAGHVSPGPRSGNLRSTREN